MRLEEVVTTSKPSLRLVPGLATGTTDISVGGITQPALWLNTVDAEAGDPLQILLIDRPDAQTQAVVIGVTGNYTPPAPEAQVVAAPPGSNTISVKVGEETFTANFLSTYTPTVGDKVRVIWQGNTVTVLGKIGTTAPPAKPKPEAEPTQESAPAPPPPAPPTGYDYFSAADSCTWAYGVWNTYGMGRDVYQGNGSAWGGPSYANGAWFYHGRPGKLKGKTITRVQFWVPPRERAGSYNSGATMNVKLHRSSRRPSGDVNRVASHDIFIPAGFRGGWKDLPASWGDDLTTGSGIGIAGGTYMGFTGIGSGGTAKSGQLRMDWRG